MLKFLMILILVIAGAVFYLLSDDPATEAEGYVRQAAELVGEKASDASEAAAKKAKELAEEGADSGMEKARSLMDGHN